MPGNVNCMHSKLQLLFHPSHLRVVVPSANLTPYDWGEDGKMENVGSLILLNPLGLHFKHVLILQMVFMVDLPRLPCGRVVDVENLTFFGKELVYFLQAMVIDEAVVKGVLKFDFTGTSELAFVHTM
jgi:Tyrosyl-DNA phosphodiesterase